MLWAAIQNRAFQYVFMTGGAYVLTATLAIVLYSSRMYSNRSNLAAVGKPYVPIEQGEVGTLVRRMIAKQLERSAIIAWESKPRDLYGEILLAEDTGLLPPETGSVGRNDYTVGLIIPVDPERPPWGDVQHAGWSSPSHKEQNQYPGVRFHEVISELPNLIEARAVSLAQSSIDAADSKFEKSAGTEELVVDLLRRPANAGLRQYLAQLACLNLINPPSVGEKFIAQYERSRFSGRPASEDDFNELMATFSGLLAGMTVLDPVVLDQLHLSNSDLEPSIASNDLVTSGIHSTLR